MTAQPSQQLVVVRQTTPVTARIAIKSKLSSYHVFKTRQLVLALSCRVRIEFGKLETLNKIELDETDAEFWHLAFTTLVPEICVALNNTANATTSVPTSSSTPTTSSTVLPFTGDASKLSSGLVGLVGVTFLAWML